MTKLVVICHTGRTDGEAETPSATKLYSKFHIYLNSGEMDYYSKSHFLLFYFEFHTIVGFTISTKC